MPKSKSLFAEEMAKKKKAGRVDYTSFEEINAINSPFAGFLKPIIIRDADPTILPDLDSSQIPHGGNIPPTILPDIYLEPSPGKSLCGTYFAQRKLNNPDPETSTENIPTGDNQNDKIRSIPCDGSYIASVSTNLAGGETEAEKIHSENLNLLAGMSEAEILEERKLLFGALDEENPTEEQLKQKNLLNFLKNYSKKKSSNPSTVDTCNTSHSDKKEVDHNEESVEQKPLSSDAVAMETNDDEDEKLCVDDLPIRPIESHKWVNMKKIEFDKLAWTKPLPELKSLKENENYVARFSLSGELLPYDADINYREALHHHGEEPERAGYSLEELFMYARSSVVKQRQLALSVLANMLSKLWQGYYHKCFDKPFLKLLLDSGLVLLIRFGLDDSNQGVQGAAASALSALLGHSALETCINATYPWGEEIRPGVSSKTHAQETVRQELEQEESELKDSELLQLDVIKALLRMDTHIRLLYIIEHLKPQTETVLDILSILCRIASHSSVAAWTLQETPRLLSTLSDKYFPSNISNLLTGENVDKVMSVEGVPLRHFLTLLKILSSWDKLLAHSLVKNYSILDRILPFVSQDPTEIALPLSEALNLSVECYSLWSLLLSYGLIEAQAALVTFWPMVVRQLLFYRDKVSINEDTGSNSLNFDIGAILIHMLSHGVSIAASRDALVRELRFNESIKVNLGDQLELLQAPLLQWQDMLQSIDLLFICGSKWFTQLNRSGTTFSGLKILGSVCNFFRIYIIKSKKVDSSDDSMLEKRVAEFYDAHLSQFLRSDNMSKLINELTSHSALCSKFVSSESENTDNIWSINSVVFDEQANIRLYPMFKEHSPFPLLLPLVSLISTIHQEFPAISSISTLSLVNHPSLLKYLEKLVFNSFSLSEHWFTRIESKFLFHLCSVALQANTSNYLLYHKLSLRLMPVLQKGQEFFARQLLKKVITSETLLIDTTDVAAEVEGVALSDTVPLKSPALMQSPLTMSQMNQKALKELELTSELLIRNMFDDKPSKQSAVWAKDIFFLKNTLSLDHVEDWRLFDDYWLMLPVKRLMLQKVIKNTLNNSQKDGSFSSESSQTAPGKIREVSACLELLYLFLRFRKQVVLSCSSFTGWIRHIALTFIVADDLFLDHTVNSYLQGCLRILLQNDGCKQFNDKLEIPGLGNTFDWYKKLIEQYISVSYGDFTFALFLLIPCQQRCPIAFRSMLWGDLSDALSLIRLKVSEVEQFMPIEVFTEEPEKDPEMLLKYQSCLVQGVVSEKKNPFLYYVAVQHLKRGFKPNRDDSAR